MRHLQMQPGRKGGLSAGQCQARVSLLSPPTSNHTKQKSYKLYKACLGFDCKENCFLSPQCTPPLPPSFLCRHIPPLLVDRGEIEYTPHVEVLCAWPAVVWNSDFWSGWWSWMFVVWDLLLPSLLRDAALKEQTHFGPMLCRVTLYYLWPHYRLATILFIIDQAKNELEVLTEQLEKLEKQTQYTTGEKKRPQSLEIVFFWSTCIYFETKSHSVHLLSSSIFTCSFVSW